MKIFEVGLICEFEGGHGVLIAGGDNLFRDARTVLIAEIEKEMQFWNIDANDDGFDEYDIQNSNEYLAEYGSALSQVVQATSIDELRKIKIDKPSELVMIKEREVIGGDE